MRGETASFRTMSGGVCLAIAWVLIGAWSGAAQEQNPKSGTVIGQLKSQKNTPDGKNTFIEVIAPGEEQARRYHVLYDAKAKGPIETVLKAVRAAKMGDRVELKWVQTGHGPAINSFQILKKGAPPDDKPLTPAEARKKVGEKVTVEMTVRAAKDRLDRRGAVTADNFTRAETDRYFASAVKRAGGIGKLVHRRQVVAIDKQTVIRANRDTLYSSGVFDLDAGPVTITLPDAGKRFLSLMVIDEDHYAPVVVYGAGQYTYTREQIGTRYVMLVCRTLVDPTDAKDSQAAHQLQDAIKIEQNNPGAFEVPNWEPVSQKKVRDALLVLNATLPDLRKAFGRRDQVDPVRHLIATASAWGGNPDKDAVYLNVTPDRNDGTTVYRLTVKDVPVDGFWSISVYNAEGYFQKNEHDAYTLNNLTAKRGEDRSITIQFGGCDGKTSNCLPITPGWNYLVRLYRPRPEILDGTWKFPESQAVK
jgi:hypothetical protein